jgi:hypothetical protein
MNKSILKVAATVFALSFCASANAAESLPGRAVEAIRVAIASQGNAALLEVRREMKEKFAEQVKPFLPQPATATAAAKPARR